MPHESFADSRWAETIEAKVNKHHKDLYEGNGLPSITTRLDRLERFAASCLTMMRAILLLLIGAILTGIVDLAVRAHK